MRAPIRSRPAGRLLHARLRVELAGLDAVRPVRQRPRRRPAAHPVAAGHHQLVGVLPGAYLGPLTAVFVVTAAADGRAGLRHWSRRLVRRRVGRRWYLAVLAGVPAAILLASFALPGAWGHVRMISVLVAVAYLPTLLLQVVTTVAGRHHRDRGGARVAGLRPPPPATPLSLVMTWVFHRTHESLPIVMVPHASINTVYSLIWARSSRPCPRPATRRTPSSSPRSWWRRR